MEGRQSRASSRYGSVQTTTPVFTGPVRRWKKQWVSCSQSAPHGKNISKKKKSKNNSNLENGVVAPLMLWRWTPLASDVDEPRRRRFRYAPVVPIRKKNMEVVQKVNDEARASKEDQSESEANMRSDVDDDDDDDDDLLEKSNAEDSSPEETNGTG